MSLEKLPRELSEPKKRELTPWEGFWLKFKDADDLPASLKLHGDFLESLSPNSKVIDMGCGFGRVAMYLVQTKGVQVTGVDINPSEIKFAQESSGKPRDPRVDFYEMDATYLDFKDNHFDSAIMLGVLGGVDTSIRKELLAQAFRVVKPGGKVAVAEYKMNLDDPVRKRKYIEDGEITGEWGSRIVRKGGKVLFYAKHFMKEELAQMFEAAGFHDIEVREQTIRAKGIGDGIEEDRQQLTVWGVKPGLYSVL